MLYFFYWFIAV